MNASISVVVLTNVSYKKCVHFIENGKTFIYNLGSNGLFEKNSQIIPIHIHALIILFMLVILVKC